jgi:aldehyde:ferredoxin oxidoreductase
MNAPHDPFFADENSFSFKSVKRLGIERAMDPVSIDGEKVKNYVKLDLYWKMMDALGLCVFGFAPRGPMPLEEMIACIDAVTGWKADLPELLTAAERGTMLARAFNSREGFSVSDDRLPGRLFTPKPDGPDAGRTVFGEADFGRAILGYYREIGCDPVTGRPLPEKMRSLGIDWVNPLL